MQHETTHNDNQLALPEPKFGEWLRGIYASESNPHRDGMYVRTIRRTGKFNPGKFYELTDGNGLFWQYPAQSVERLDRTIAAAPEGMDTARLDWIAHHSVSIRQDFREEWFLLGAYHMKNPVVDDRKRFGSAREAIDAAMLAAAQQDGTT